MRQSTSRKSLRGCKLLHKAGLSRSFRNDGLMLHYGIKVVDYKSQCKTIAVRLLRVSSMLGREPLIKLTLSLKPGGEKGLRDRDPEWYNTLQYSRVRYGVEYSVEYTTVQ